MDRVEQSGKKARIVIGCVYRPPSMDKEKKEFSVEFDRFLETFTQASKECIIVGDCNIDISDKSNCLKYMNILESNGFQSHLDLYTS